jgi:GntR family transcriptional regulator
MKTKDIALLGGRQECIDRDSYEPVYSQLVSILRRQVANGVLRPGDQLPSEAQLCLRYQVSPMTVRRAINILVDQGVVVAEQGRGTFIRPVELGTASFQLQRLQEIFGDEQHTAIKL